ncbi:MAG TPA: cytochrome c oxidase assembly protein [Propionibacteriaceae bacterium]|nr:cytochrome c oxidase assembly protein [Propionibacteriaceae bacterium]
MPIWPLPVHATDPGDVQPLTLLGLVTDWEWDWVAGPLLVVLVGAYLWGVLVLRRRGDAWSLGRTASWLLGSLQLAYATVGPLGAYDTVLFSVHMVQHMMLSMTIPVALAQGAPVTLALRTLPRRLRAGLLWLVGSRLARIVLFPPLTTAAMILMPFVLYTNGLYGLTLRNDVLHDLLHLWLLAAGSAFFMPLVGPDPTPWKVPYPIRILLFFLTMPFHAFIGTMIMGSKTLLAGDWYLSFPRAWGPSPMSDQYWAGAILWATGDFTALAVMSALFLGWYHESQREARRVDRQLDREERARSRQEEPVEGRAQEAGATQAATVSGATMQPLPPDTRTDE